MALSDVVRSGIALANQLTDSFQVDVEHHPWTGYNGAGEPVFGTPVVLRALHERKQRLIRTPDKTELLSSSSLTIVGPVAENGADDRREPIDTRDRFVFFNGESGKVLDVQGLDDPLTGRPYMYQVFLG